MARNYPADTQIQKFLEESYNKETHTRLTWYQKSLEGEKTKSKQFEVFRKRIEAGCPKPTQALLELKHVQPKSYHKRKVKDRDDHRFASIKDSDLTLDMLPVKPQEKELLYDGFTKAGRGRYQYLQHRYQTIPEIKYQYPVLSSWEYGWRLPDVIKKDDIKKPDNGRTRIVGDTFYTRTGIPSMHCSATY